MTTEEFSNQFDVLYNNIMSNQAPGIDEYEKSIFLTKAQEELVRDYFNDRTVKNSQGFDDSRKRQYDFSTLLSTVSMPDYTDTLMAMVYSGLAGYTNKFDDRSKIYIAPSNLFLAINESIVDSTNRRYSILPISYSEYNRLMLKPYGYPLKRQAWRIISDRTTDYVGYGGKVYTVEGDIPKYVTFLIKSKYNKTLYISINLINSTTLTKPTVNEYDSYVEINMQVPKTTPESYWKAYLADEDCLTTSGLVKYIYPPNGTTGMWPSGDISSIDKTIKINIVPASTMSNGTIVTAPIFEIIGRFTGDIKYTMRYVKTPRPIILVDLDEIQEGLSINGYDTKTECELPLNMHQEILQRAVELAKASYQGDLSTIIQTGNASGTDIGYTNPRQQ